MDDIGDIANKLQQKLRVVKERRQSTRRQQSPSYCTQVVAEVHGSTSRAPLKLQDSPERDALIVQAKANFRAEWTKNSLFPPNEIIVPRDSSTLRLLYGGDMSLSSGPETGQVLPSNHRRQREHTQLRTNDPSKRSVPLCINFGIEGAIPSHTRARNENETMQPLQPASRRGNTEVGFR